MTDPNNLEARVRYLEEELPKIRDSSVAALTTAANTEAGHADMRICLRAHTGALNALRTTQLEMQSELKRTNQNVVTLGHDMDLQFEEVYRRFAVTDQRLDKVDHRLDKMDQRFDAIDQRFTKVDQRFSAMDRRFDAMDERFSAMDRRFDAMDQRFDTKQQEDAVAFARIEERFASVREEFGIVHSGIARILEVLESREKAG